MIGFYSIISMATLLFTVALWPLVFTVFFYDYINIIESKRLSEGDLKLYREFYI